LDGKGWVASEYLKFSQPESIPTIGEAAQVEAKPTITALSAIEDHDSMQAPLAAVFFSPTNNQALQITGDVSSPIGDLKDWIQFSTDGKVIAVEATCQGALQMELWNKDSKLDSFQLPCGNRKILTVAPNNQYVLNLSIPAASEFQYINYTLKLETLR